MFVAASCTAVGPDEQAAPKSTVSPETAPDTTEASTEVKSPDGLTLGDARRAIAQLRAGMLRRQVEKLLGPPDETLAKTFGGRFDGERWDGLEWIYEWEAPEGGDVAFVINFKGESAAARVTHFHWRHTP
jgi:hypothetical protein